MMEKEFEGKSLDQVIEMACQEFGCLPEDLEIEILEYSSAGLLSITSKKVRAKVRVKPDKLLTERANKALSFLKELFYYAELQIETKTHLLKEQLQIEIYLSGEDVKFLIQNGAEPLSALEFLTNKVVAKALGVGPKIVLKPEGINIEKEKKLINAVKRALEKIKTTKEPQVIKIGNQREQRLVLNLIKEEEKIGYVIEGEGRSKRVILSFQE